MTQYAIALLASPTLTGVPAAPTAADGTSTTQLATTAFVTTALAGAQPAAQGSWLVAGGGVAAAATSYDFTVSAATYYIGGTRYTSAQTVVTLTAADGALDRFDAIIVTTSGTVDKITGTAASNPALPDLDPVTQFLLTYVFVQAASSAPTGVATTSIYAENTEWTSSVSGGTVVANSTSNPHGGTKDVEATTAVAGNYVRFTSSAITLSDKKQLVFWLRSKATWASSKSLAVTWYSGTDKIGQSAAIKATGTYGFTSSTTGSYQQIVIPIGDFAVPATSTVTRLEVKVAGGGAAIGWYLDDVVLEGASTSVSPPATTPRATASVSGTVRTTVTDADPLVYLKSTVDTALALKANLASPALTGNPTAPTQSASDNSTKLATTAYVDTGLALAATLASPTLTGTPVAPTAAPGTNTTQIATTAFVAAATASSGTYTFFDPNKPQASPSALDDEFTGNSMSAYTGVNTGAVITFDRDTTAARGLWVKWPASANSNTIRAWLRTLPAGDCSYQLKFSTTGENTNTFLYTGICLSDGTTAAAGSQWIPAILNDGQPHQVYGQKWTNFNNFSANEFTARRISVGSTFYLWVSRSGTTWSCDVSGDGQTWSSQASFTEATLGFTPANVGPFLINSTTVEQQVVFRHVRYIATAGVKFGGLRTVIFT